MSDTLITIVAILLAAILMFVFPLMSVAERSDDMSSLTVQTATTEFVDNARAVGKITMANYQQLVSSLNATGNTYDIEMEVKVLDENVAVRSEVYDKQPLERNQLGQQEQLLERIFIILFILHKLWKFLQTRTAHLHTIWLKVI